MDYEVQRCSRHCAESGRELAPGEAFYSVLVAEGAELRLLRWLVEELDPARYWGGLRKTLTPEWHYLWLCEEHAAEYKR